MVLIKLTSKADRVSYAKSRGDYILAREGNDEIVLLNGTSKSRVSGGSGSDTITTGGDHTSIYGDSGADRLIATSKSGFARLIGGSNNDRYVVNSSSASVIEFEKGGYDVVETGLSTYFLPNNTERLESSRELTDTRGQVFVGNALANDIYDSAGNDRLEGRLGHDELVSMHGNDVLIGGTGNDGYTFYQTPGKSRTVKIIETGNDPYDAVQTDFSTFVMSEGIDNLIGNYGFGTITSQRITGNSTKNTITDGLKNDSIKGMAGNDTLRSFWGNDTLDGGKGNDLFIIDAGTGSRSVRVVERVGQGFDTVQTDLASYEMGEYLETLIGSGSGQELTGNKQSNTIYAGWGEDELSGGSAGNDRLYGGGGNDTYIIGHVGERPIEEADNGYDKVISNIFSYTLNESIESLAGNLTTGQILRGNATDNDISANIGSDSLNGSDGSDTLAGRGGNDFLVGGDGVDSLSGGTGSDAFAFESVGLGDHIKDFERGDKIWLVSADFGKLPTGRIANQNFVIGNKALDSNDFFLFRTSDKTLWYDSDGNGTNAAVLVADLDNGYNLAAADIVIVSSISNLLPEGII
jgi:serralysin